MSLLGRCNEIDFMCFYVKKKLIIDLEFIKLNFVFYNKYINFYEYVYINSLSYCVWRKNIKFLNLVCVFFGVSDKRCVYNFNRNLIIVIVILII